MIGSLPVDDQVWESENEIPFPEPLLVIPGQLAKNIRKCEMEPYASNHNMNTDLGLY